MLNQKENRIHIAKMRVKDKKDIIKNIEDKEDEKNMFIYKMDNF